MTNRTEAADRRARAAQVQAEAKRAERRRGLLVVGAAVVVAAVILGGAALAVVDAQRERDQVAGAAKESIDGVMEFDDLSRNHVTTAVEYPQTPPVGGDHAAVWTNCGVYTTEVDPTRTTHSLEHGAVWIGYDPDLPAAQVEELTQIAQANSYVVLSPVPGVPSPITASAWGVQLEVEEADDPRLEVFVAKYQQGPQTPEPGAACTGGAGGM